jgi:hypothetical protein
MDNQQGKMEQDLSWLAGFLDGEGSLMVKRRSGASHNKYDIYSPTICVVNTDMPTLDIVIDILKSVELPFHVSSRDGHINKDSWDIRVSGYKRCKRWLEVLTPYLRTKKGQAVVMLEYINSRLDGYVPGVNKRPTTEQEMLLIQQLRKRVPLPHRLHASIV